VKVAPFAVSLLERILDHPETEFRTKAGTFGFISRLGVDWNVHLPLETRSHVTTFLKKRFMESCQSFLDVSIDPSTLGYCCDTAVHFGLQSDDFTAIAQSNVKDHLWSMQPLALVQTVQYLNSVCLEDAPLWEQVADRLVSDVDVFSVQNIVAILPAVIHRTPDTWDMIESVSKSVQRRSSHLRIKDCAALLESLSRVPMEGSQAIGLVRAIQRRLTVLIATSPVRIPASDLMRISTCMSTIQVASRKSPLSAFISTNTPILGFIGS
jgi:hypothetical protein